MWKLTRLVCLLPAARGPVFAGLLCVFAFRDRGFVASEQSPRFICTPIPVDADPRCSSSGSTPHEEQLRMSILQQKDKITSQQNTIKELTSKVSHCEAVLSFWRKEHGTNTMGDLARDPAETVNFLGQTMETVKSRLENLEQQVRGNASSSPELGGLLWKRLGELEKQLFEKVASLDEEKTHLYNETALYRHHTQATLTTLLQRISELERVNSGFVSSEKFKLSLPLRTNYLYGRITKSLPEMYAFTVCLWLRSSGGAGIGTPFSYGVPGQANEVVLIEWGNNPTELLVNDQVAQLPLSLNDGNWHHVCVTWTTRDGVWEAYQDGEKLGSGENLAPWHPIKPGGVIILGQEQDTVGGRFDATQAFVGDLSHFNMWDRVLKQEDISSMANCSNYMPGNVVPWISNNVEVFGGATKNLLHMCEDGLFDS